MRAPGSVFCVARCGAGPRGSRADRYGFTGFASSDGGHGPAVGTAGRVPTPATCRVERGFRLRPHSIGQRQLGTCPGPRGVGAKGASADAGASQFNRCADSCALALASSARRRTFSALRVATELGEGAGLGARICVRPGRLGQSSARAPRVCFLALLPLGETRVQI